MARVSPLRYRLRQLVAMKIAPHGFSLYRRASRLAEVRFRRTEVIHRHVRGAGIEVGALASPSIVPPGCRVTYVDKYGAKEYATDPELAGVPIAEPDVLDDAECLASFEDDSQDFVLAFAVAEHVQNPLGMLRAFHRVTRDGGTLVISAPDKRFIGDRDRPITTFEHLVDDDTLGADRSFEDHVRESGRLSGGLSGAALEEFVDMVRRTGGHIHFHVWDSEAFLAFLYRARAHLGVGLELLEFAQNGNETLVALRVRKPAG